MDIFFDVFRRNAWMCEIEVEFYVYYISHPFAFKMRDGALEKLAVEVEADRRYMAGLLRAEQVARAAQFKIAHGEVEASSGASVPL
jgi:hypothetical protein